MEPGLPQRRLRRHPRRSAGASLRNPQHRRPQLPTQGSPGTRRPPQAPALVEKVKTVTLMEPNDLPIVVLPLELSDDSVANLIDFLHALTEGLQRHYAAELLRREHQHFTQSPPPHPSDPVSDDGPPF